MFGFLVHVQVVFVLEPPRTEPTGVRGVFSTLETNMARQGMFQAVRFGAFGAHKKLAQGVTIQVLPRQRFFRFFTLLIFLI